MPTRARSVSRSRPGSASPEPTRQATPPSRRSVASAVTAAIAPIPSAAYLTAASRNLRGANRFLNLAAGLRAEDDEDERDEEGASEEEEGERAAEPERKGKKKGKRPNAADERDEDDEEDDEDAHAEEDEDEEDEEDEKKERKAVAAQARTAERTRWAAVMSSKVTVGRIALACSLLADTGMSAEKICGVLAASPTEARQGLAARMAEVPRPDVGSGPAARALDPNSSEGRVAAFKAAISKATGREFGT